MADFGIISGAVGIATAFSACVDCFEFVQKARHLGRDVQTDLLALKRASLRLTRWGLAVNVYTDPKLSRPDATQEELRAVHDTLRPILILFTNAEKISQRYGLEADAEAAFPSSASAEADSRLNAKAEVVWASL